MNKERRVDDDNNSPKYNKKSVVFITLLVVLGIILGVILSSYFYVEANQAVDDWNERMREWQDKWNNSSNNFNWSKYWEDQNNSNINVSGSNDTFNNSESNNTTNQSNTWGKSYDPFLKPIEFDKIIMPSIGVICTSITLTLLVGLIITYYRIYKQSKSKYIYGLMLVFTSLFITCIFFINTIRTFYFSSAFEFDFIGTAFRTSMEFMGIMLIIIAVIESIGLGILLYLSNE